MEKEELLVIEPITAYREWEIKCIKEGKNFIFRLCGYGRGGEAPYLKNGINEAICLKNRKHKAPV